MKKKCEKLYKEWLKYCYNIDKKKDPFHIFLEFIKIFI